MSRLTIIGLWITVIVVAAFMLYRVKYEVQSLKTQVAEINKEIIQERESLRVVSAEWAYLNRPERLKALSDKYLNGTEITVGQVAEIEAIAFHKQSVASADMDDGRMGGGGRSIFASYSNNSVRR